MVRTSVRRELAIATWNDPREGNIYGRLPLDATEAVIYLDHLKRTSGEKVTITNLIGKCVDEALKKAPTLNGYLRLGSYIPHKDGGHCLSRGPGGRGQAGQDQGV